MTRRASLEACQAASLEEVIEAVTSQPVALQHAPWLRASPAGLDLLGGLLRRDPACRLTAGQALQHPWFAQQLGEAWVGARLGASAASQASQATALSPSAATDAVWQAAQHVALRLFT